MILQPLQAGLCWTFLCISHKKVRPITEADKLRYQQPEYFDCRG